MPVDPKQAKEFVQSVLKTMKERPESLTEEQRRLCRKQQKYQGLAVQFQRDIQTLTDQIRQAEAAIRSKELQVAEFAGKANMAVEFLVSLQFEDEVEADSDFQKAVAEAEAEETSRSSLGLNRKGRRAIEAQQKHQEVQEMPAKMREDLEKLELRRSANPVGEEPQPTKAPYVQLTPTEGDVS